MTQPSLPPAQVRVWDWLAESPEHQLRRSPTDAWGYITVFDASKEEGQQSQRGFLQKSMRSLIPHLYLKPLGVMTVAYIHPKFAGGKHE